MRSTKNKTEEHLKCNVVTMLYSDMTSITDRNQT